MPAAPPPLVAEAGAPAQGEMPFAVVEGEPITELPRDLYIPPYALEVFLEAFEGPLDLLLYLIRRQNLDILDIPIAEISRQYVQYIELMKEIQFELAGEYLVMAATLAEIKSRMLLPRSGDGEEDEEDPRAELVRRLQEYERFKKAAGDIDALERLERDVLQASAEVIERPVVTKLPDITLKELLIVFKEALERSTMFAHHHVRREPLSVRERMSNDPRDAANRALRRFSALVRSARRAHGRHRHVPRDSRAHQGDADRRRAGGGVRADSHSRGASRARAPDEVSEDRVQVSGTDDQYNG